MNDDTKKAIEILAQAHEQAIKQYESMIARLPGTKKTKGDLVAGFFDGFASAIVVLRRVGS
jgi:hypothetical protein